jgi:hypothetical protein
MNALLPAGSTILFVTAQPGDQEKLNTDEEYREMDEAVRGHFLLRSKQAARPGDLIFALAEIHPRVLHFSGHGAGAKGLVFQRSKSKSVLFRKAALTALLDTGALGPGQLVVLNACSTLEQAALIAEKGCDVVAMRWDVLDRVAQEFAAAFYRLLCSKPPAEAFKFAYAVLKGRNVPEAETPEFLPGKGRGNGSGPPPSPDKSINLGALRRFLAGPLPEDSLANVESDIADYRKAMGAALDHMGKPERVRRLIGWLAERQRLSELIEKLRSEVPELMQKHESELYS